MKHKASRVIKLQPRNNLVKTESYSMDFESSQNLFRNPELAAESKEEVTSQSSDLLSIEEDESELVFGVKRSVNTMREVFGEVPESDEEDTDSIKEIEDHIAWVANCKSKPKNLPLNISLKF